MDRDELLIGSMLSCLVSLPVTIWAGSLSDRVGRRPLIMIGGVGILLWAFPYFMLVNTASLPMFMIAVTVAAVFQSMTYGPIAAYMGELFEPHVRYSGASLAYQLAAILISGSTPFIMTWLISATGTTTLVAAFVAVMGLITFASAWRLRETNPASVREDPNAVPGLAATN